VGQQLWVSLPGIGAAFASVTSPSGRLRPPLVIAKDGGERIVMAEGPQVVTPQVARRIRSILRTTATHGTARTVNLTFKSGTASGKTGTGEVENAASDAVFVALAPWDAPEWIVVVSVRGGGAGSGAGRLAGQILNLLPFGRTKAKAREE
jgi:cell division protein FtsI/penicillin-binding protein 2